MKKIPRNLSKIKLWANLKASRHKKTVKDESAEYVTCGACSCCCTSCGGPNKLELKKDKTAKDYTERPEDYLQLEKEVEVRAAEAEA